MSELLLRPIASRRTYRVAVSCLFFLQGLCFASWASRIPSIQQALHFSEAQLGLVLFALPAGSMVALSFAGYLVNRFGSKKVAIASLLLYSTCLLLLGFSYNAFLLLASLFAFGIAGNLANIAINTQAVGVEARYGRNIMASFHGLWSLAGFAAAGIGTFMIGRGITPLSHFLLIAGCIVLSVILTASSLLNEAPTPKEGQKRRLKPDALLMRLGIIAFCCMVCEGSMFDWSGIYFKKVVKADKDWVGAGYTAFMLTMATGRFIADWATNRLGFKRTIQVSGSLIAAGLGIAVAFPYVASAIFGFLLVGFGVSSVVPLVYSEAGKSKTMSPGSALAAVSSIGFMGFLLGPPVIGVIAELLSLRASFLLIALVGVTVALLVDTVKQTSATVTEGKSS